MISENKTEFLNILTHLGEYYNKTLSPNIIEIYWNGLKSLTIDEFKKSVDSVVQSRKYTNFPMIADFLEAVNPPEKTEMLILKAMTTFKKAITKYGYTKSFHFKDTVLSNLIQSVYGGWYAVLNERHNLTDDELNWWDKKFEENYPDGLIVLGAQKELTGKFKRILPKALQKKVIGDFGANVDDNETDLIKKAQKIVDKYLENRTWSSSNKKLRT